MEEWASIWTKTNQTEEELRRQRERVHTTGPKVSRSNSCHSKQHKYNTRAPHCCKQRTTTLAPTHRDPEPATLNIIHVAIQYTPALRSQIRVVATRNVQNEKGIRRHKLEAKMLTKKISTWWWCWCCQHKWREEDEADPPRRCSLLRSSRRMREKGKETTCALKLCPWSEEDEGDRGCCAAPSQLFTPGGGGGYFFYLVPTGSLYLNKSKSKDRWLGGLKSSELKNRRVRVSQPL